MDETRSGRTAAGAEVHAHLGTHPDPATARQAALDPLEALSGAGDPWGQARDRAGSALASAADRLRSHPLAQAARDNPLAAVGVAFAVGFLLAGRGSASDGQMGRARQQLKGAIVGGLGAALMQELRGVLEEEGADGLLGSLTRSARGGAGESRPGGTSPGTRPSP